MLRVNLLAASVALLIWPSTPLRAAYCAAEPAQVNPPISVVQRSARLQLVELGTGDPIENAAVTCTLTGAAVATDTQGVAVFQTAVLPEGGTPIAFHASARGYAPILAAGELTYNNETWVVRVPSRSIYQSELVYADIGADVEFAGLVPPQDPVPFDIQVQIPAGALPVNAYVECTPYAHYSTNWKAVAPGETYPAAYLHLALRNEAGELLPAGSLLAPITVRTNPWFLKPSQPATEPLPSSLLVARSVAPGGTQALPTGFAAVFHVEDQRISWQVNSTGLHGLGISIPPGSQNVWLGNTEVVHAPTVAVLNWLYGADAEPEAFSMAYADPLVWAKAGVRCIEKMGTPFTCGHVAGTHEWELLKGEKKKLSSQVLAKVAQHYKVKSGAAASLLADAEVEGSVGFEVNAAGEVEWVTTETFKMKLSSGEKIADECCSGLAAGWLVEKGWKLKVGSEELEVPLTWTPSHTLIGFTGAVDNACHKTIDGVAIDCAILPVPNCTNDPRPPGCQQP